MEIIVYIHSVVILVLAAIIFCQHRSTWEVEPEDIDDNIKQTEFFQFLNKRLDNSDRNESQFNRVLELLLKELGYEYQATKWDPLAGFLPGKLVKKKRTYKKRVTKKKK